MKRFLAFLMVMMLFCINTIPAYACDEEQSRKYVSEIIFGDDAAIHESDKNAKMLMSALYLCCEQSDKQGQDKIDYLKKQKVSKVPTIASINVTNNALIDCAHIGWDFEYAADKNARSNRKKILQNTVKKVFDFGMLNEWFGGSSGKSNSMAALLYYSHILADCLADNTEDAKIKNIPSYCGQAYIELNDDQPEFTFSQKRNKRTGINLQDLDNLKRCVGASATLGKEDLEFVGPRPQNLPNPTGWKNNTIKYDDIVNTGDVYNRCHLIARSFCGVDNLHNLITGTRYLNDTMNHFENKITKYLEENDNHVAYRVTPIYAGNNLIASGVQLEAFSIEDKGGLCFNVYCYNVQPGIKINYATGEYEKADQLHDSNTAIPFAINNPSDENPDLIYEICKHLKVLFGDKKGKDSTTYTSMMNEISIIANDARSLGTIGEKPAQTYLKMKECEYKFSQTLKTYVPQLLKKEDFFKSAFK